MEYLTRFVSENVTPTLAENQYIAQWLGYVPSNSVIDVPRLYGWGQASLCLLSLLCCMEISQGLTCNDISTVVYVMLRIIMNKSIVYAGMTLTYGFTWERAFAGVGQVVVFLLVYVSQFVTNRRMSIQIQNDCTSCGLYAKHVSFSFVTFGAGAVATRVCLSSWGFSSFGLICSLDALGLMTLSSRGIMRYCIKAIAVILNVRVKRTEGAGVASVALRRRPAAEMAFCTEMNGLVDALLEICFYFTCLLEYFALYMFRDGIFIHVVDLAILLDIRYLIAHSKKRLATYTTLHQRSQYVIKSLPRVIYVDEGDAHTCPICMEDIKVARKLGCGHVFHVQCLLGWVQECNGYSCTCPICRSDLITGHFGQERHQSHDQSVVDDWNDIQGLLLQDLFESS